MNLNTKKLLPTTYAATGEFLLMVRRYEVGTMAFCDIVDAQYKTDYELRYIKVIRFQNLYMP